jgi:hypothetical protein
MTIWAYSRSKRIAEKVESALGNALDIRVLSAATEIGSVPMTGRLNRLERFIVEGGNSPYVYPTHSNVRRPHRFRHEQRCGRRNAVVQADARAQE